jgi:single-stranded DNA-specific DHH superfamily exonuclease
MAKREARLYPETLLCVYLIDTPHYISGLVASALTSIFPAYLILVGQKVADRWSFEIRSGISCGIDITDVLRRQRENYRSLSAGGHPRASGALIKADEVEIFLTTFKEALEEVLALNR